MTQWNRLRGVVVEGYRVASGLAKDSPYPAGTIAMQTPSFRERGLDIRALHPATIGVSIAPMVFSMERPTHTFRDVKWSPEHDAEDFSFSPCHVVFRGEVFDAWVYYPHPETKIGHPHSPSTLEIVAPRIPGIAYGAAIEIDVDPAEIAISKE